MINKGSLTKRGNYYTYVYDKPREFLGTDEEGNAIYSKRKQCRFNTKCEKKADALKEVEKYLNQMKRGLDIQAENITLAQLLLEWLENQVKNKREKTTYEAYKILIESHIIPYFGKEIKLKEIQPLLIQNYYNYLLENGRKDGKGKGLSSNSVYKQHVIIHNVFKYAVKTKLVDSNIADMVDVPKRQRFRGSFYTDEEIAKLINIIKETPIETPIFLAISLGLRRGEILGLRWKHVNFEEKTILVCETRVHINKGVLIKEPKTESSVRTLPIPEHLVNHLKKVRTMQKESKLKFGSAYTDAGYVCCYDDGRPLDPAYLSHKWKEIVDKSELPSIRLHDLRHTAASFLLKQGATMKEVQEVLGHKQISTTFDIYAHVDMEMKRKCADRMNKIFNTM